jgi:hypothetical protein
MRLIAAAAFVLWVLYFISPVMAQIGDAWGSRASAEVPPPRLISPEDGSLLQTPAPTLVWENIRPATHFYLQLDDDPNFASPNVDLPNLTGTQQTVTLGDGTWYWRMRQYRHTPGARTGAWSKWSEKRSLTIAAAGVRLTTLTLTPSSAELVIDGSAVFEAVLKVNGSPLAGRTIVWEVDGGTLSQPSSTTDASGVARVTFHAPSAEAQVKLRAVFEGEAGYSTSSAEASISIAPITPSTLAQQVRSVATERLGLVSEAIKLQALENAFAAELIAGVLNLWRHAQENLYIQPGVKLSVVEVVPENSVSIEITATGAGRTVVLNVGKELIPGGVRVLVDGQETGEAEDYLDALAPDENEPEYFAQRGSGGLHVLLSIPSFSTRTITLLALPVHEFPLLYALAGVLVILAIAGWRVLRKPSRAPEVPAGAIVCPGCGRSLAPTTKFCGFCGQSLEQPPEQRSEIPQATVVCPACNRSLPPAARFCGYCGQRLEETQPDTQPPGD